MDTTFQNKGMTGGIEILPALWARAAPEASIRFETPKPVVALIKRTAYRAIPVTSLLRTRPLVK